jgi:RNA polymerase sigma-70 factor (ECF subfamily)
MANLVAVLALAVAAPAPSDDAARKEREKFDGNWRMVSVEADGARMPAQQVNGLSLTFKAGKFTSHQNGERRTGTYVLDPTKSPKAMDIVHDDGPQKGKTWALIYTLEGNTLRICGGEIGKDRPAGFDTKDQPGIVLMVLRRE